MRIPFSSVIHLQRKTSPSSETLELGLTVFSQALRFTWHRLQTRNGGKKVENVFEEVRLLNISEVRRSFIVVIGDQIQSVTVECVQVYDRLVRQLPAIRDMFTTRTFLCAMSRAEMASLRDHAKVRAPPNTLT